MLSLETGDVEVVQRPSPPPIPEEHRQIAEKARFEFEQANYSACLQTLNKLHVLRPEDVKVFHNICVVEYYLSNCSNTSIFYNNLLTVCKQAHLDQDFDLIDDIDQSVVFYNKAVIFFHLQKYKAAIELLDKVFQFVESLEETLALKICFLLIELYLTTNQPKKALSIVNFVEVTTFVVPSKGNSHAKSIAKDSPDNAKAKLVQYRARCFIMLKTFKPCKREVKALMASKMQDQHIAGLFIKSKLEYSRQNFKKSMRIITSVQYPKDTSENFLLTGDPFEVLNTNNLACVHHAIGKSGLAVHYLNTAINIFKSEQILLKVPGNEKYPSNQPIHTLRAELIYRLVFNLGIILFKSKKFKEAFYALVEATKLDHRDPLLWLRIAECCIYCSEISRESTCVRQFIGSGVYKKAILNPNIESLSLSSVSATSPTIEPTLNYAMHALKTAWNLLPKEFDSNTPSSSQSLPSQTTDDAEHLNVLIFHSVNIQNEELQKLRNHILIKCSYASLRCGNVFAAHTYAVKLLSQPRLSDLHRFLANSYAAESLVSLDRISEAIDHYNPELITGVSKEYCEDTSVKQRKSESSTDNSENIGSNSFSRTKLDHSPNLLEAKAMSQYNLAVVYTIRGEWGRACEALSKISLNSAVPVKELQVYIDLCQGATDVAKNSLKECFATNN